MLLLIIGMSGCASSAETGWKQQFVVQDLRLNELSGLSESVRYPGYFWANNDSGDSLRCFLVSPKGETVATVNLAEYKNIDTESLRVAGTPGHSFVYISDTGDNRARREQVEIYRFAEPEIDVKKIHQEITLSCEKMSLKYGDGIPTDAETLLISKDQRIAIVTKSLLGSKFWITARPFSTEPQTLQMAGIIPVKNWKQHDNEYSLLFTDGAISNDGKRLALMTYTTLFIWKIPDSSDLLRLAKVLLSPPDIKIALPKLRQPESLSFMRDNSRIAISTEGANPPVMIMDFSH